MPTNDYLHDKGTDRLLRDIAALDRLDKVMKLPPPKGGNIPTIDEARLTCPLTLPLRWHSSGERFANGREVAIIRDADGVFVAEMDAEYAAFLVAVANHDES